MLHQGIRAQPVLAGGRLRLSLQTIRAPVFRRTPFARAQAGGSDAVPGGFSKLYIIIVAVCTASRCCCCGFVLN